MFKKLFAFPVVRAGAIAILALAMLMSFPTTRALASELLNFFRVQQVAVLPIDMSGMESLTGNEALGKADVTGLQRSGTYFPVVKIQRCVGQCVTAKALHGSVGQLDGQTAVAQAL